MKKLLKRLLGMLLVILAISIMGGLMHNEKTEGIYNTQGILIGTKEVKDTFTEGFVKTFIGASIMTSVATIFVYGCYLLIDVKIDLQR